MRTLAVAAAMLAVWSGGEAWANGRFPASQYVVVGPGVSSTVLVVRTTFGLLSSVDGGAHWAWLCEDFLGYGTGMFPIWDPPLAIGAQGADGVPLLVGIPTGLMRTYDRCTVAPVPEVGMSYTGDITEDSTGTLMYWVASDNNGPNPVYASVDGGRTFTRRGMADPGVLLESVESAETNPERVYVSGTIPAGMGTTGSWVLYRSEDGGGSLESLPLDLHGGIDAWVSGIDPTNADVVYMRSQTAGTDGGATGGSLLLRSADGGQSFTVVMQTVGAMTGFAISGDGATVWTGGSDAADGLYRSDDHGMTFHRLGGPHVACLRWHSGVLYVCGSNAQDGYALGQSTDGGQSVQALARFSDIAGPPSCPSSDTAIAVCDDLWPSVQGNLGLPMSVMDAGTQSVMDAGLVDASLPVRHPPATDTGCGCTTAPAAHSWWGGWITAAGWALGRRRKRRRASVNIEGEVAGPPFPPSRHEVF